MATKPLLPAYIVRRGPEYMGVRTVAQAPTYRDAMEMLPEVMRRFGGHCYVMRKPAATWDQSALRMHGPPAWRVLAGTKRTRMWVSTPTTRANDAREQRERKAAAEYRRRHPSPGRASLLERHRQAEQRARRWDEIRRAQQAL